MGSIGGVEATAMSDMLSDLEFETELKEAKKDPAELMLFIARRVRAFETRCIPCRTELDRANAKQQQGIEDVRAKLASGSAVFSDHERRLKELEGQDPQSRRGERLGIIGGTIAAIILSASIVIDRLTGWFGK